MTKDQVKAVLARVPTWPDDRQHELAELALEIKAELADAGYEGTPDELAAIDEGVAGEPPVRRKLRWPSPCSGVHESRTFEAGPSRISNKFVAY